MSDPTTPAVTMGEAFCVWCRRQRIDPRWRPFCSERCKLQDLARWADGSYRIPSEAVPDAPEPTDTDPT